MKQVDAIVAGAGVWGCTLARRLAEAGRRVLVLERRSAVGGNVRCEIDSGTGIEIHTYGSHIFHTHDETVWNFVRRFVSFNGYQHKVLANYRGKTYFLPLGLTLVNKFFGTELRPSEVEGFLREPGRSEAIFDAFFRGYTSKQWGRAPEAIDPSIIRRVPVRTSYDVNYFNDCNQGIPSEGYNALFDRLLDHPSISVECGSAWTLAGGTDVPGGVGRLDCPVYYSGPVDELFGYRYGALPWRSLRFETERVPVRDWQGTSVVNYTEASVPYTRIHEFKHYHPEGRGRTGAQGWGFDADETIICREYPEAWKMGGEPYYPIVSPESAVQVEKYREAAAKVSGLVLGGRLGAYRYYDMDQAMAAALAVELPG